MRVNKVGIIGAGCAGLSAAIYCARAGLEPIVFCGNSDEKGGQLMKTSIVENYPGFPEGINGFDLIEKMEQQAEKYGAKFIDTKITLANFSQEPYILFDQKNNEYYFNTVIICTGSTPNKLQLKNEDKLWSKGISSCAVCDGALYRNKEIMVVGGGDSAMEEALFLTKFSNVKLIHRRDEFRASKIMQDRVINHPKIDIMYNKSICKLNGDSSLESVNIIDNITKETTENKIDGLFYGLGLNPNSELFDMLDCDSDGYLLKNNDMYETMTKINGVFVAGDVTDKIYKQAVVAAGEGCKAALDVIAYLDN